MIVITTPTGQIGAHVVERLLEAGAPLRVIVRDASSLAAHVRASVEIVEGSHADPKVVDAALRDAQSLLWLVPADHRASSVYAAYVDFTIPAADAIVRHRVQRVVTISALGREQRRYAGYVSGSIAMDDLVRSTGASVRALTMPSFTDNLVWQVGAMRQSGAFFSPIAGDLRMPTVATRDVAAVATQQLLDDSWSGHSDLAVLGAEDLSFNEMAAIISDVLETPIRFQQISHEAYLTDFLRRGFSPAMAHGMLDMARAKEAGLDNGVLRTRENSTPTTFRQWCTDTLLPAFHA